MTSRYIQHENHPKINASALKIALAEVLNENLALVEQHARPERYLSTGGSKVYVGLAGIALMNYYLCDLDLGNATVDRAYLASRADMQLLASVLTSSFVRHPSAHIKHISFLETDVGIATLVVLRCLHSNTTALYASPAAAKRRGELDQYLPHAVAYLQRAVNEISSASPGECEVLYGRAGLLYALVRLRFVYSNRDQEDLRRLPSSLISSIENMVSDASLAVVINEIITIGKEGAREYAIEAPSLPPSPLMWSWHGKRYLGGAHGVVGILNMLFRAPAHLTADHLPELTKTLEWLVDLHNVQRNWPSKAPTSSHTKDHNDLVQ